MTTMCKWESLQALITRMPGGRFIGTQWDSEPLVEVRLTNIDDLDVDTTSRAPYTFQQNLLIAAVHRYGPLVPDTDDPDTFSMQVPPLVAEMLDFWADEFAWTVD